MMACVGLVRNDRFVDTCRVATLEWVLIAPCFVAFEPFVITAALLRHRSEMLKHATASAPAPAH
jgi:hypothetical protein